MVAEEGEDEEDGQSGHMDTDFDPELGSHFLQVGVPHPTVLPLLHLPLFLPHCLHCNKQLVCFALMLHGGCRFGFRVVLLCCFVGRSGQAVGGVSGGVRSRWWASCGVSMRLLSRWLPSG